MSTTQTAPAKPAEVNVNVKVTADDAKGKPPAKPAATPIVTLEVKPKVAVDKEIWQIYCRMVSTGAPTKVKGVPILPARLSQLLLTDAQREELRAAREQYRRTCMGAKKSILGILRRKTVHTVGHKTTARGGNVRYADEKAYKTPTHFQAFLTGKRVADLAPAAK